MLMHHIPMVINPQRACARGVTIELFLVLSGFCPSRGGGEITLDKLVKGGRGFGQAKIPSTEPYNFSGKSSRVRHGLFETPHTYKFLTAHPRTLVVRCCSRIVQ